MYFSLFSVYKYIPRPRASMLKKKKVVFHEISVTVMFSWHCNLKHTATFVPDEVVRATWRSRTMKLSLCAVSLVVTRETQIRN